MPVPVATGSRFAHSPRWVFPPTGVVMLEPVLARVDRDFDAAIERWSELLRIPSISTDPDHTDDMRRAAQWLVASLQSMGFEASVRETDGHPAVIAHHPGPGDDAPHLLYYGHYDVQPPDPLELWDSGPFEPTLVEGPHGRRMVARGAVDDKGQLMMWLEALRAWHAEHGTLPVRVTVLLEGEEEVGSRNLRPFLERNRDELAADVCVVSDTTMWDVDTP
ncbi:MAG: M20/M25/M40 family metallo-hydrolase, partial [Gammaproteobacteria bacterium]|nr:M20/M25/M40 family metallo-hydrolase [Gammaproteobacteria bacterium]